MPVVIYILHFILYSSLLVVLVIPLSLLVVLIAGTLVTWKMFRKHSKYLLKKNGNVYD